MDESRSRRPQDRRPLDHPMTGNNSRRTSRPEPLRLDAVLADEGLLEALRAGRRPGDALAELLGAWRDDINADDPTSDQP